MRKEAVLHLRYGLWREVWTCVWVCGTSRWEKKNDEERLRQRRRCCVWRRERRRRFRRFHVRYLPAFFVLQRGIKPDAHSSWTTFVRGIRFLRKISSALKRILRQILLTGRKQGSALDPTVPSLSLSHFMDGPHVSIRRALELLFPPANWIDVVCALNLFCRKDHTRE